MDEKYKCPECGWIGSKNDLTSMDEADNICPHCIEWSSIIVLPDLIEENNERKI